MSGGTEAYASKAIAAGSQSFAAAAKLFDPAMRRDATALYAWCRHCDDVVDGQTLGRGRTSSVAMPAERLAALRRDTEAALGDGPLIHPAFEGLRGVIRRCRIPAALPLQHLDGFRMDIEDRRYLSLNELLGYCYGVAGVVGVMMAHVMGATSARTLDRACDLGLAFQMTNIARDVIEDARNGRIYLPLEWLAEAGVPADRLSDQDLRPALAAVAARLVLAAEPYYESATVGLGDLPLRAAWTIGMAKEVYRAIGRKVVARGASAWDGRVSTTAADKLRFVAIGGVGALASRFGNDSRRPADLWSRPALQAA